MLAHATCTALLVSILSILSCCSSWTWSAVRWRVAGAEIVGLTIKYLPSQGMVTQKQEGKNVDKI